MPKSEFRHDWQIDEVLELFARPFNDLIYDAQAVHRKHFDANAVQLSTLLSIKTGGCPEDCAYCPQSSRYDTEVDNDPIMELETVRGAAKQAREAGASRFCMGAAWRNPTDGNIEQIIEMIRIVQAEGLESCATLGMLTESQADALAKAGLDYYNHNLDTSPEYYEKIITTRSFSDRLETLGAVRQAGMRVCCGGIVGMGETLRDRAGLLQALANLPEHPQSVPINHLVRVEGTPLDDVEGLDPLDFVRTVAVARLMMPAAWVRLSAGRQAMSDELHALCFLAGANSIFYGEKLLTTGNPDHLRDQQLFQRLGLSAASPDSALN